jgi:hypothetical protein
MAPETPAKGIPFVITNAMKAQLRELGFDDAAIYKMTPGEAWQKLAPETPAERPAAAPVSRETPTPPGAPQEPRAGAIPRPTPREVMATQMREDWARDLNTAQRLGVAEDIERLSAEEKNAQQISLELGNLLDPIRDLARANKEPSIEGAVRNFVRNVRNARGIPSLSEPEFAAWRDQYRQREAAPPEARPTAEGAAPPTPLTGLDAETQRSLDEAERQFAPVMSEAIADPVIRQEVETSRLAMERAEQKAKSGAFETAANCLMRAGA